MNRVDETAGCLTGEARSMMELLIWESIFDSEWFVPRWVITRRPAVVDRPAVRPRSRLRSEVSDDGCFAEWAKSWLLGEAEVSCMVEKNVAGRISCFKNENGPTYLGGVDVSEPLVAVQCWTATRVSTLRGVGVWVFSQ